MKKLTNIPMLIQELEEQSHKDVINWYERIATEGYTIPDNLQEYIKKRINDYVEETLSNF